MAAICEQEFWQLWPRLHHSGKHRPTVTLTQDALLVAGLSIRQIFDLAYRLRTIRDLYWQLATVKVKSIADLKKHLRKIHWSRVLSSHQACQIEFRSYTSRLYHEKSLLEASSDELSALGLKLSQNSAKQRLRFHLKDNQLHILLALSDQVHYRRGLRSTYQVRAPLAEHYAAALIHWYATLQQAAGRGFPSQVYIPFAGSGTFAWELISWFYDLPPSLLQQSWVSESWPSAPRQTLGFIRNNLLHSSADPKPLKIRLCERSSDQCAELSGNLQRYASAMTSPSWLACWQAAQIEHWTGDFFHDDNVWHSDQDLAVFLNPPYGLRLSEEGAAAKDYGRVAERLNVLFTRVRSLSGLILIPNDACYQMFQSRFQGKALTSLSWNQGGRHVRALYFFLA